MNQLVGTDFSSPPWLRIGNDKSKGSGEFGGSTLRMAAAAGRGVTNVMQRCESAKVTGYLDLSDCGLMYVADAIYLVLKDFSIDKCNLRNNVLTKFPKKMVNKFENMLVLNLEGNQIEEIPNEIAEWSTMRGLNIANNKLTSFPEALYSLKQLTFLDISGNEISDIDVEQLYTSLPGLAQLTVSKTQLSTTQIEELEKNSKKPPKMRLNFV
ncbi:hypothetical protein AB6A40_001053 [Gnathostoma spinigerum]|uniref:Uncharacterized protein n=1 Tax=Gnathostoma spinigerum TaxID=75299 RepID=A0ABD6EAG1_9BILA